MSVAYLGLGSNLPFGKQAPAEIILSAVKAIHALKNTTVTKVSSLYYSKPYDNTAQPDFINVVIEIKTALAPLALLKKCQRIELAYGRPKKHGFWSARTLDIDILLYEKLKLKTKRLTVPHYDLLNRPFFMTPLLEINSHCVLPVR